MNKSEFDILVQPGKTLPEIPVKNLFELIFMELESRRESSDVILSHVGNHFKRISLQQYRSILLRLYQEFIKNKFKRGDTVMLASVPGNNECFVAILFSALASFGMRVLLPMFMESSQLDSWIKLTGCKAVIYPGQEILSLSYHEKEKKLIRDLQDSAGCRKLPIFDSERDFHLSALIEHGQLANIADSDPVTGRIQEETNVNSEALIITTSGSSGKSQLVVYTQGAFLTSCISWQSAGFFTKNRFAGPGFTPLFTHTMGIRSFFNALWCGYPVCLINSEWFIDKPETVRYLLLKMKPQHLTGGPAAFRLLLEMMRNYPELKTELAPKMKVIISSGASFRRDIVAEAESVFTTPVFNAFGTTETQQVLNTLLIKDSDAEDRFTLGLPLPGVTVGLKKYSDEALYRMYIQTPFGCERVLGENNDHVINGAFFQTGDIVRYDGKKLHYIGRENTDFTKGGFGVKVPLATIRSYYHNIHQACEHCEYFPLLNKPGLAALIFQKKNRQSGIDQSINEMNRYFTQIIEEVNELLYTRLDPFVFRHHTLRRFSIVDESAPMTPKGSIAREEIKQKYEDIISELVGVFPNRNTIRKLKYIDSNEDSFSRVLNPYLGAMLHELKMDYSYHRGQRDILYSWCGQEEIKVLDMVGGYGTNFLGHNCPEIVNSIKDFYESGRVSLSNQGSLQKIAGELAEKLNHCIGQQTGKNFHVCLGSSGAEVVEMALHHACLEWRERLEKKRQQQFHLYGGHAKELVKKIWDENWKKIEDSRLCVVVSSTSFHGHTSGARSLLNKSEKRDAFINLLSIFPVRINDQNSNWKTDYELRYKESCIDLKQVVSERGSYKTKLFRASRIVCALFEPVIGEGGIRVLNRDVLHYFADKKFPLIIDEIQSGLGRCGSLLASEGIDASYYLFAKALGGGVEKIGALLIESTRYREKFGKYYTSTFANGELAACVALKTLDIIEKQDLPMHAEERGTKIAKKLNRIRSKYPDVISEITGKGLMQGIRFADTGIEDNIILRILSQNKMLGYLYASYLLNRFQVRILPSLSASNVLRVEPSVYITNEEIGWLCKAIEGLAKTIHKRDLYRLCKHLMDEDPFSDNKGKQTENGYFYSGIDEPAKGATRITFIGHFAYPVDELRAFEKDFTKASDTGLRILSERMQMLMEMEPVTLFQKNIFRNKIHFTFMIIPIDSADLERRHREGERRKIVEKIQKAVDIAAENGSRIISLGGYTSILTNNGMAIAASDTVKIITGNTLTAASGLQRIFNVVSGKNMKKAVVGIVGAPGNIGSILSEQLAVRHDLFSEIYFIGRKHNQLESLHTRLREKNKIHPMIKFHLDTDLDSLIHCDVIVISTNTNDPIIFKHHIKSEGTVIIVDNSVPAAVNSDVLSMSNVINLPFASYIQLPDDSDFVISSYTPQGTVFCCAAEAMLCGLEKVDLELRGTITNEAVALISKLAEKHCFFKQLGGVTSFKTGG